MIKTVIGLAGVATILGASPGFAQYIVEDEVIRRPLFIEEEVVRRPRVLIEEEVVRRPRVIVEEEVVRQGPRVIIEDDRAARPAPEVIRPRAQQVVVRRACTDVHERRVQADGTTVSRSIRRCG
jgi:hypothetical protein